MVALARSDRAGAWRTLVTLEVTLLAVGIFVYPSSFTANLQTPIGWFENDVYTGLLLLSLYLSLQRMRDVVLASRR
jgi:hypothetical protein